MDVVYCSQVINDKILSIEEVNYFLSNKFCPYYSSAVFRNAEHLAASIFAFQSKGYKTVFIRDDFFTSYYLMYFYKEDNLISKIKRLFQLKEFL